MIWLKLQRLKAKDPDVRLQTVEELAASGERAAFEPVVGALKDENEKVREAAALGLGQLKDKRGLEPLLTVLKDDPKADVRAAAAQSLRHFEGPKTIEPLLKALYDASHSVRWHAVSSLNSLGWRPANHNEIVLRSVAMGNHDEAASLGKEAVESLVRALADPTTPKRNRLAISLGKTGDARAVKPLEAALTDEDSFVRVAAIEALGILGASQSASAIMRCLEDANYNVRAAAIEILGKMGDPRIVDPIAKSLINDSAWDVRKLSVEALGRIKHERAPQLLWHALKDADYDVRQAAAVALGQIPDPRSIGPLVLALKDENSSVRQAAKGSLRQIDRHWEISDGAQSVIPELEAAINDREYWVAQSAADTLAKINDMRQRMSESNTDQDPARNRMDLAINILTDTLKDLDRDLRQAAAEALGRFVDNRVVAPLAAALDDKDQWVGRAAALALNHLNWNPAPEDKRRAEKMKTLMLQS